MSVPRGVDSNSLTSRAGTLTDIFISYRREDSPYVTGRIRERLEAKFGRARVFTDVDSIPLGVDFKQYIESRVGRCRYLLAIIGPSWADVSDADGIPRLEHPRDFVRAEIEAALARDVPVIPVLVQGAMMPDASKLPDSLLPLLLRNGLPIRPDPDFDTDVARLIAGLTLSTDEANDPLHPRPLARLWRSAWVYVVAAVVVGAGAWLAAVWRGAESDIAGLPDYVDTPPVAAPRKPPARVDPDWRVASATLKSVGGIDYYRVDYAQGLTAVDVCALVRKRPGEFATDHRVCSAFYPDAPVESSLSGDRAVAYCSGSEDGVCREHAGACIVCDNCLSGVAPDEWAGRLYQAMFTTCR